jgi:CRISPR-associated protein Cas2
VFVLISYDIPADKRRTRLAKLLLDYGNRVQYSVFECDLTEKQMAKLLKEVKAVISEQEDSVRVYRLCVGCVKEIKAIGRAKPPEEEPVVFIV